MINFKSNIVSAPFKDGESLNELACLSMDSSSLVNYLKLKNVLESVEECSTVYLYRPEAYLHPFHLQELNNLICRLEQNRTNYTLNVYSNNESLLLTLGEYIRLGGLSSRSATITVEFEDGICENLSFDSNGVIKDFPVGYFNGSSII